jgi:NodT family efflux transporter outer membrane factor (OMF) lipoprotein
MFHADDRSGPAVNRFLLLAAACVATLANGCNLSHWVHNGFKVGPNYGRPEAPVSDSWIDYHDPRVLSDEPDLGEWWRTFDDPVLNSLVDAAYEQNLSLRVAGARILEARARRGIAVGNLFPQVQDAFGSYTRNKVSEETSVPVAVDWFSNWEGGFNLAWELDFWGRFRRAVEAADAELDARIENYDDVLVLLLSDVAASYVEYRTFQERLIFARENVEIQAQSYQLAQDKFNAGATTERDVHQAKQVLEQTRALIPELEAGMRGANNALCVLLGVPPRDLAEMLAGPQNVPVAPPEVAVGIPADLIRRRPDVRRAEREVAAQSARIGIAEADFYPRLSLIGTLGVQADDFDSLFDTPDSMVGAVGPTFQWAILNYGRILNNVRAQDARFQELAFAYQDTVLRAGREAEDALVAFLKAQEQTERLEASVEAAQRALEITDDQYRLGAVDFTPVFLFQSTLAEQQDQLAASRGNIAISLIAVYRALGGGWEMRLSREGVVADLPAAPLEAPLPEQPAAP